jgi:hypothetical protein
MDGTVLQNEWRKNAGNLLIVIYLIEMGRGHPAAGADARTGSEV